MLTCPHCQGTKINKSGVPPNGKKTTGIQNFLCRTCKKQFQLTYKKNGANPVIKKLVTKALCRNSGITDIENIFEGGCHQLSKPYILHTLVDYAETLDIKPQKQHYKSLQIDEFWTYVGSKNNKKWLLYAYCPQNSEIVGYVFGDTSEDTIKNLYAQLATNKITVADCRPDEFCTDNWKAFAKILLGGTPPKNKHKMGGRLVKRVHKRHRRK